MGFLFVFLPSVASQSVSSTTSHAGPPAHPGYSGFLGKALPETMQHRVNGQVVASAVGKFACEYAGFSAPAYLRASWNGTVQLSRPRPSGAKFLQVTWLGWNNVLLDRVDRYLIVKDLDDSGKILSEQCTTYPDVNPKGYMDPLPLMADRYNFVKSSQTSAEYVYHWDLQDGAKMTSTMLADGSGFPPRSVSVSSKTKDGQESSYDFVYEAPQSHYDSRIFYEYKKHRCTTVSNFTTPEVCVDSWLALQYECAFTQAVNHELLV